MSTPTSTELEDSSDPVITETPAPVPAPEAAHPDPITGEPGAHPVGVGVGALGAGAAGAALGAIGGPIGMLIGAAIGAVAGGLAGKEVAAGEEVSAATDLPAAGAPATGEIPSAEIRPTTGVGFAGEAGLPSPGSSATPTGLTAPLVPEAESLAEESTPRSGEEAVRVSAYYLFIARSTSGQPGTALGDWLEAEREMMLG